MSRILVFACVLGLLAGGAAAQEPYRGRTTLAEDSLAGPVRSTEVRRRFTADGRNGGPPRPYEQVVRVAYDREGRRTEHMVADSGVLVSRMVYAYDDRGRNTGYVGFAARGEVQRVAYAYDAAGRLVGRETTGEIAGRERYLRDEAGRLREEVRRDGSRTTYRYDAQGRRVEEVRRMADGTVLGTVTWEHGPAGPVRETRTDGGGLVRWVFELRYDAEGRLAERTTRETNAVRGISHSHAPVPGREVYAYRDGGRTVETAWLAPDGMPRRRKVERFDARGRLVESSEHAPDGTATAVRWSYDDDRHGNWTRRRLLVVPRGGGELVETHVETREIAYW